MNFEGGKSLKNEFPPMKVAIGGKWVLPPIQPTELKAKEFFSQRWKLAQVENGGDFPPIKAANILKLLTAKGGSSKVEKSSPYGRGEKFPPITFPPLRRRMGTAGKVTNNVRQSVAKMIHFFEDSGL